jgi:prevent-host-death family protein
MTAATEVGAYEAKTHLAEFLRQVRDGKTFRITQRGEPVADLVPVAAGEKRSAAEAAARMAAFLRAQPPVVGADTQALVEEGRD